MPIHPGMVEPLAEHTRDLYAEAEARLLGIIARQLAADQEAPGWAERKLAAVQALRRASQAVVDELGRAVELEVFDAVAESYNVGHRAAVAELGSLSDDARRLVDEITPNAQAVDRIAQETVDVVTSTHRSILRAIVDGFRGVVSEVLGSVSLGIATRRQATQDAMARWARRGITAFVDRSGRRWQLTSYAEMAVRTGTARAATEAHMRVLTEAGIDLVVVSDSPRECHLCRPWEGRVLALSGPDGARTVRVEHATEDDRMVPVRIAGTLDEAHRAGLQHPNCRHSVSAYTPGITRIGQATSDPDGYEAGQRQRAIERHIREWKRRQAAAITPEAKRAAGAKVRAWQGAMRQHLAEHPDLRRLRHREQPGAGNLPPNVPAPPREAVEAARVRSGDQRTPSEMTDEQLAAAVRAAVLDERDLARVQAELDRRDLAALLDRVRPAGTLAEDLTEFSDDELARVVPHLSDADTLRVMAEMDRRDLATRLPGVRADLVGLSDADLAQRGKGADPATLAVLAAEAGRRDLLARLFPGGQLLADLSEVVDDELAWAMQYATADELARIAAEMDRRDDPGPLPQAADTGAPVADLLGDWATMRAAVDPAPAPEEWGAYADDAALTAAAEHREGQDHEPEPPRYTRGQIRELYDEYLYTQYLKAEEDCRGELLNRRAEAAGVDPISLFSGPARIAYARASDELREWWATNGRLTLAEFTEQVTGQRSAAAERARQNEADRQQRR